MKILVTGCAGFVGSHIAEGILRQGHEVIGIDNLDPYYSPELKKKNLESLRQNRGFKFISGSILDKSVLKKAGRPDMVNHQAAMAGVRSSIKDPMKYFTTNVLGTINLLEAFRDTDKFIYASSSSIYGEVPREELPVSEERKPMPISPYSLSKLQGEAWCNMFSRLYGYNLTILRYFTVYGPRQRPDEAICKFIRSILAGRPIEIYGDGSQTRDFTYVKDVVDANILALGNANGLYNIGSGKGISVKELLEIIFRMAGRTRVILKERQAGDVQDTLADITKARNELGYKPKYTIESGLREYIGWLREQKG
jgi:UDP-glucose 4-epimerase